MFIWVQKEAPVTRAKLVSLPSRARCPSFLLTILEFRHAFEAVKFKLASLCKSKTCLPFCITDTMFAI